jgi:hypothetical protein
MGGACSTRGGVRNVYKIVVGKPEGKAVLGRHRRTRQHNITRLETCTLLRTLTFGRCASSRIT